jgi:opacity protein-like surface antigen
MHIKKMPSLLCGTAALILLPLHASAFDYTYIEGGYLNRDFEHDSDSGYRLGGAFNLFGPAALIGEYTSVGDLDTYSVGGLVHVPVLPMADLFGTLTLEHADNGHDSDTGYGLSGGLRWQVLPRVELAPELRYVHVYDDDNLSVRLNGLVHIVQGLNLQAAVQGGDDDRVEVGLRYSF